MKAIRSFLLILFTGLALYVSAQGPIDSIKFFQDESIINTTLEMDLKDLLAKKARDRYLPATFSMTMPEGNTISEKIQASVRGNFRRETCYMPGLYLKFHNTTSPLMYKLDKLKLSNGCNSGDDAGQLVIKEYLAYKIYNILTEKSLKVRLAKVSFKDVAGKRKSYTQFAFFLEDVDAMARRNNMVKVKETVYATENTNRNQMTLVTLFEYLIANTDWSVPSYHNIKLIAPKDDKTARPFAVAYDFDICGLVNPPYATVDEQLQDQITTVRERLNRGFPRTMEELKVAIQLYNDKKDQIINLIKNNEYLSSREKKDVADYIEDFYKIINNEKEVNRIFVEGGRKN